MNAFITDQAWFRPGVDSAPAVDAFDAAFGEFGEGSYPVSTRTLFSAFQAWLRNGFVMALGGF